MAALCLQLRCGWACLLICSVLQAGIVPVCRGLESQATQVYIVHLHRSPHSHDHSQAADRHARILTSVHSSYDAAVESRLYSYRNVMDGFSAALTSKQAASLAEMPGVRAVAASKELRMLTTHSWDFLGLGSEVNRSGLAEESNFGQDVIVGVIDSGIWPEAPSFGDEGFGPIPSRWKGRCTDGQVKPGDTAPDFIAQKHCNKKIIGARYYVQGLLRTNKTVPSSAFVSPRDSDGHGTHVASTVAGRYVEPVDVFGTARGAARGGAPFARLAVYKVCWPMCMEADILAAFDDAIDDGVDILSISLGYPPPQADYFQDPIAVGTYQAFLKGILSVCAAGNAGPEASTATCVAPWILTVAATSMDRRFLTPVTIGNVTVTGRNVLLQPSAYANTTYPLGIAADAYLFDDVQNRRNASLCIFESLDPEKVKGKIMVCEITINANETDPVKQALSVREAGGIGAVFTSVVYDTLLDDLVYPWPLPVAFVSRVDGNLIKAWAMSTPSPTIRIGSSFTFSSSRIKAPSVAAFSSRGPNNVTPEIIKPDISAPGVGILAAWSPVAPISDFPDDTRRLYYQVQSGTSMATPHVSALAALVKAAHPTWSPAAIKSAIMTTATRLDNTGWPVTDVGAQGAFAGPYALGTGQINPGQAASPGLIFDSTPEDHALLLCASGYNASTIAIVLQKAYTCPSSVPAIKDFNYPSIHFYHGVNGGAHTTVSRTATNVGRANSTYRARVIPPPGTQISVQPSELQFTALDQQLTFTATLSAKVGSSSGRMQQVWGAANTGAVVWIDDERKYTVSVLVLVSP